MSAADVLMFVDVAADQIAVPSGGLETPLIDRLRGIVGLVVLVGMAWVLSTDRTKVPWRVVGWGFALQIVFALLILKPPYGSIAFDKAGEVVNALLAFTMSGASFVFGNLAEPTVPEAAPAATAVAPEPAAVPAAPASSAP